MEVLKEVTATQVKALSGITEDMNVLENEIRQLSERMDDAQAADKAHSSDINNLREKMHGIQMDMEKFEEILDKVLDDKEKEDTRINVRFFNSEDI